MYNIDLIVGDNHEGKTKELLTKYYNFCNGDIVIEEDGVKKTFKNYDLVKPYFIHIEEEAQVLRNMIKNIALEDNEEKYNLKSENFDMKLFNTIESKFHSVAFLDNLLEEDGDKVLFIDFNLSIEELNYFLKDFFYKTGDSKYHYDLFITVTKPKYLKDVKNVK